MIKKIGIFIIAATMALSLTACGNSIVKNAGAVEESTELFERHRFDGVYSILVDKKTGVCYLERRTGNQYGITVMLNADGTPKIWEEE